MEITTTFEELKSYLESKEQEHLEDNLELSSEYLQDLEQQENFYREKLVIQLDTYLNDVLADLDMNKELKEEMKAKVRKGLTVLNLPTDFLENVSAAQKEHQVNPNLIAELK